MKILYQLLLGFMAVVLVFAVGSLVSVLELRSIGKANLAVGRDTGIHELVVVYERGAQRIQLGSYLLAQGNDALGRQLVTDGRAGMRAGRESLELRLSGVSVQTAREIGRLDKLSNEAVDHVLDRIKTRGDPKLIDRDLQFLEARVEALNLLLTGFDEITQEAALNSIAQVEPTLIRTMRITVGALLSSVLLAIVVALVFARRIARPVTRMTEIVRAIAENGDVSHVGRVPQGRGDEIGELAKSTNVMIDRLEEVESERTAMSARLEALNRTLEQRVEERTERLAQSNESLSLEMNARLQLEVELRQAQKLEAVGRLASGVAHEINTPVQFVNDSVHFVQDAMNDLSGLVVKYKAVCQSVADGKAADQSAAAAAEAEKDLDLEYLLENVPKALDRSIEGLNRVTTIVRSMKEFAYPDQKEMSGVDINEAIESTLIITRNEYKYVADIETHLGELPTVVCHAGDVNQAVLNIIVNAAHAIGDVVKMRGGRGRITVGTHVEGEDVVITITDTGGGIPEAIRHRIFDPFFTTKEVGKGTGQGLAIARSVVRERHGGELSFETETDKGTTFSIRLPIAGKAPQRSAA